MDRVLGNEYVCYCTNGHRNTFKGHLAPANCRQCNAAIDMIRGVVSLEADIDSNERNIITTDSSKSKAHSVISPDENYSPRERNARVAPMRISIAQHQPPEPNRVIQPPKASRVTIGGSNSIPKELPNQTESIDIIKHSPIWKTYFDFYGEKIEIPAEGGWLGRSAIGSEWFQGNLLISRKHLYVKPLENGSVCIGPEESLNGVYYDIGEGKLPLVRSATEVVPSGSIIWLYNIPLKLECIAE